MRILSSYYFLSYLSFSVFLPYISLYFSDRGFSNTAVGVILSLWAFVGVVAQPVMGIVNDRMRNPRTVLMVSVLASPLIGVAFGMVNSLAAIIMISILFVWFQSSTGPLSDAIAVEIGTRQGFSFGSVRLWGALSYSIGTFTTGFLYEKYGYQHIFIYFLAISLFVFVLLFRFPDTRASHHRTTMFDQAKEVFGNKPFMAFVGICMLLVMSSASSFTFIPIYFKELGFDKSLLGSAYAVAAIIEVPMFWFAARISGRIGKFNLLSIAAALYGVRCLVLFLFHDVYLTLLVQLLDGMSFAFAAGTYVEVVESYASDRTKATFQTIFAAVTWGLGGIIGNAAGGVLVDRAGAPFLYLILFIICGVAAALFLVMQNAQTHRKQDAVLPAG